VSKNLKTRSSRLTQGQVLTAGSIAYTEKHKNHMTLTFDL